MANHCLGVHGSQRSMPMTRERKMRPSLRSSTGSPMLSFRSRGSQSTPTNLEGLSNRSDPHVPRV